MRRGKEGSSAQLIVPLAAAIKDMPLINLMDAKVNSMACSDAFAHLKQEEAEF